MKVIPAEDWVRQEHRFPLQGNFQSILVVWYSSPVPFCHRNAAYSL